MRKFLLGGLLTVVALLPTANAEAYEGPWCMRANAGFGSIAEICHFQSFEACREGAGGHHHHVLIIVSL